MLGRKVTQLRRFHTSPAARRTGIRLAAIIAGLAALALVLDACFPLDTTIHTGRLVTDRHGTVLSAFLSRDHAWRFPTTVDEVSPVLVEAIIRKEDRRFRWHGGIDPVAIVRAIVDNLRTGRRMSGASTITMQVVRLLEPRPRTIWSKLIETVRAWQLELHHSKDEILGMYLTLAPYGGNIEGVRAASLFYLGTTPRRLSVAEATTLLIVPNRPTSLRLGGDARTLRRERDRWIARLAADGLIDGATAAEAAAEPLHLRRRPTPRDAWHVSVRLARAFPGEPTVRSTVDASMQHEVEALTRHHVARLRSLGIENASVMVVDNATRDVLAYVGSADPHDTATQGQVDGIQAVRSPGSTLKPLVYALAIDRGLMTPRTMLDDVPVTYGSYAPENFDRRYHGAVSMEQALVTSLNVPAVTTLDRVGVDAMVTTLANARFQGIAQRRASHGLSLVLGGCGVRLEELTGLYTAFANGGLWRPLRWTRNAAAPQATVRLCSPGAAWMVSDCLTQLTRPDLPNNVELAARLPRIAWKTGTSYGRRDAWSVGYGRRYTVGVWVGNFDGRGNEHLTGAQCATPLLFDVMNTIDRSSDARWLECPDDVDMRFVCAMSGQPPADSCSDLVLDAFLPGVSSARPCQHQRETFVRTDGRVAYCTSCLPQQGWTRRMELDLPAPVIAYLRQNGVALRVPPPHEPSCTRIFTTGDVRITSPVHGNEYMLETASETRLRCVATVPSDATTLYWYLDDVFVTSAPAGGDVFIVPERGEHTLDCVDDRGRRARATFIVRRW